MKRIKIIILIVTCMIVPQLSSAQKKKTQHKSKTPAAKVSEPKKQMTLNENLDNMTAEQAWQKFCTLVNANNLAESAKYLKKAAEKKHLESMYFLGVAYLNSGDISLNVPKAGATDSFLDIAPSKLGFEQNKIKGAEYLKTASELGHGMAMIVYGNYLLDKGQNEEAFRWFTKAANEDAIKELANCQLGKCYLNGWGCEKNEKLGINLLKENSKNLNLRYEVWIYQHYMKEEKYAKAAPWLHIAAEKGDANAICNLSYLYAFGVGVPIDHKKAFDFAWRSADMEFPPAVIILGIFYRDGIGVEKNNALAINYFEKALKMELNEEQIENVKQYLKELKK